MNKLLFVSLAFAIHAHAVNPVTVTADPATAVYKGPKSIALFKSANGIGSATYPSQTGQAGKFLSTDGVDPIWLTIPGGLPTMVGQGGKILTNNGTAASWADINGLLSANLQALSGLAGGADTLPYFTGVGTMDLSVFTPLARTLLAQDTELQIRTLLGTQNATNLTAGTVADARLSANIPRLNGNQTWLGSNNFTLNGGSFVIDGSGGGEIVFSGEAFQFTGPIASILGNDSSFVPFTVRAAVGQTVHIHDWKVGNTVVSYIAANGDIIAPNFTGTASGTNTGDQTSIIGITGSLSEFNNALIGFDFATGGGSITGSSSGTNTGDQTSIVGITGSLAQFNAALTGADFATGGGTVTGTDSGTNTGDQTITLSGDVSGTGTGAITTTIGASKVTSAMVVDGTIVNADISGSAAIASSKIAGLATSATTDTTNASNIASGSLATARLTADMKVCTMGGSVGTVGGSVLIAGTKAYFICPRGGTITGWKAVCAPSGSVAFDIQKIAYSTTTLPTTSIVAAAAPTITTAIANKSTTLTGWTTACAEDEIYAVVITGTPATATYAYISLTVIPN